MDYISEIQMIPRNILTCADIMLFFSFSSDLVIILENINTTESVGSVP